MTVVFHCPKGDVDAVIYEEDDLRCPHLIKDLGHCNIRVKARELYSECVYYKIGGE